MSKRSLEESVPIAKPNKKKNWQLGLIDSMKDPEYIVKQTENLVAIRDKYPKAKIHYLVLPHKNIDSIYKLNGEHNSLLKEFGKLFQDFQNEHKGSELKAGFHAVPSMKKLHMHIISCDMVSACLKTKAHWNSFTTDFFIPYEDVVKELKENGFIKKISSDLHKSFLATALQCNQCTFTPKNMPQLKEHLLVHLNK